MMRAGMVAMLVVVSLCGCRCPAPCAPTPAVKVITVKIDANQNFVFNDKTLTIEEFFAQVEFEEQSNMVYMDVAPDSAITEETVVRAIRYLESHGHQVSMLATSKYAHLGELCGK